VKLIKAWVKSDIKKGGATAFVVKEAVIQICGEYFCSWFCLLRVHSYVVRNPDLWTEKM